jgi:hypothetical protein
MLNLKIVFLKIILLIVILQSISINFFQKNELSYKLSEVLYRYESQRKSYITSLEFSEDYIYELRFNYQFLKPLVNLYDLQKMTSESIFLSGPHTDEYNLKSKIEFGYYNPTFINELYNNYETLLNDKKFKIGLQLLYNKRLKKMARIYFEAYNYLFLKNDSTINLQTLDSLKNIYLSNLEKIKKGEKGITNSDFFYEFSTKMEGQGYNVYISDVAVNFWFRRYIDGTYNEFNKLLQLTLNNFDYDFIKE